MPVQTIIYFRDGKEYVLDASQVLFFEAAGDRTYAQTREHIYRVKHRLYVLETLLPGNFLRVSKSAIVNVDEILSFATLVGTTGVVEFKGSPKKLHISRAYIKALRSALGRRRKVAKNVTEGEIVRERKTKKTMWWRTTAARISAGIVFLVASALVLLNVFGVITLGVNIGILVALAALAIVALYSMFHMFWIGFFFIAATIVTIMNANGIVFDLTGAAIGNIYIVAALLSIAFHILFKRSTFNLGIGVGGDSSASFGNSVKYFEDEFDRASLECNFGGIKAYFENATPKHGEARIDVECNFGEIELYLPKNWRVVDRTHAAFGDSREKGEPVFNANSPTVTIVGEVNFGSLRIVYI